MGNYRFILEPYKSSSSRYTCPSCNRTKSFVRYIDTYTTDHLESYVGKCNRLEKCGYHYPPAKYFEENKFFEILPKKPIIKKIQTNQPVFHVDNSLLEESIMHFEQTNIFKFFKSIDSKKAQETFKKYKIGYSGKWKGANVFWQIDEKNHIRTGKIMQYNFDTGKREKNKFSWMHPVGKKINLQQCFFGLHLLNIHDTIGIVESEKTAMLCDMLIDEKITWMASGGLEGLNEKKIQELKSKNIILFPDLSSNNSKINAFKLWKTKGKIFSKKFNLNISVNRFLEENSTDFQRNQQWDLGDYLIEKYNK